MKKLTVTDAAALIIWLVPVFYLIYIYGRLPATVPLHYDAKGLPNSYGNKSSFALMQMFIWGVAAFTYLLVRFLPAIDPKKQAKYNPDVYKKLSVGIMIFLSAISIMITYATLTKGFKIDKLLFPMMGLLFAFLGNVMNNIKPNYFAGIRTPWTLEDEPTWRATHYLGARLWFIGGLIIVAVTLIVPANIAAIFFPAAIAVLVLVPVIYSYIYYKKHHTT